MQTNWLNESHSIEQQISNDINEIWLKRDDLIHPIVSGNKWRKLKYIIEDCLEKKIGHIITYGGAYSNHAIATACVCSNYNIKCTIIIRGEEPKEPNHYTLLLIAFNAELVYVSRADYKDKTQILDLMEFNPVKSLVLAEGGAHELAAKGCGEIITSLTNTYDAIFLASGTGTTAFGIAKKLQEQHAETPLYVVPVLKNENEIKTMLNDFSHVSVIENAHLGGYAKTNTELFDGINHLLKQCGVLLDPVYTAKAFLAMHTWIRDLGWKNKKILFIHTGGQLGLFSQPMLSKWSASRDTIAAASE